MAVLTAEFGYYPQSLDFTAGPVTVSTLPDLDERITSVTSDDAADGDWIYCGPQLTSNFGGQTYERPFPRRVSICLKPIGFITARQTEKTISISMSGRCPFFSECA